MTQSPNLPISQSPISNLQPPPNPTLYATVIKLTAAQGGSLPATQGRLAQAAFLDLIRAVDPALAAALHTYNRRRPYTISPLQGLPQNGDKYPDGRRQIPVRPGRQVWLRVTLLHSHLFAALTRYFLAPPTLQGKGPRGEGLPPLRLGELDFIVTDLLTTPGSHPWAGYTTFHDLYQRWRGASLDEAAHRLRIEFASPTVFSRSSDKDGMGKFMETLPTPAMFFGSLAAIWNDLMPAPLDKQAIRAYAEETVVVGLYDLRSQMSQYWGRPQIGLLGHITYLLKDRQNQAMIRALNLLADFAFYSGVGAKTALGMGMARRLPPKESSQFRVQSS